MPTSQDWLIEDHVVLVKFWGDVTAEEVGEAFSLSAHFLTIGKGRKIHFIHDWGSWDHFPTNIFAVRRHLNVEITNVERRKLGWMVAYGNKNRILEFVSHVVLQIVNVPYRSFKTQEEAFRFIQKMDPNLPQPLEDAVTAVD